MHPTQLEIDTAELDDLGSDWIEVTGFAHPFQHYRNKDGRERWRMKAKPEDIEPPGWNLGSPPAEIKEQKV